MARNCVFISLASGGLLCSRELDRAHSSAPSSLWDTVILAGFAIGTGRHPGVGVQAHPSAPEPAAMKSAVAALPLSWEGSQQGDSSRWHLDEPPTGPSEPPGHLVLAPARCPAPSLPVPVCPVLCCPCPALHTPLAMGEQVFQAKL